MQTDLDYSIADVLKHTMNLYKKIEARDYSFLVELFHPFQCFALKLEDYLLADDEEMIHLYFGIDDHSKLVIYYLPASKDDVKHEGFQACRRAYTSEHHAAPCTETNDPLFKERCNDIKSWGNNYDIWLRKAFTRNAVIQAVKIPFPKMHVDVEYKGYFALKNGVFSIVLERKTMTELKVLNNASRPIPPFDALDSNLNYLPQNQSPRLAWPMLSLATHF